MTGRNMGDISSVNQNLSPFFYIFNKEQNPQKMEVMVVSAKCTVVTTQLGRACLAHQSGDLYPASFGIKRISSSVSGITSLGKSGRTLGDWDLGKISSLKRNEEQNWTLQLCKSDVGV